MTLARQGFAPGLHEIEAYGRGGFRFGGLSHVGSILALPSGIHEWPVASAADITPDSLRRLADEAARTDLCFIGMGETIAPLNAETRDFLRAHGLRYEPMATATAARTYNVLLREGRRVAAALVAVA